jgi:O-acetyl-ADP-ribose deacetylase (regulator of RNase III)
MDMKIGRKTLNIIQGDITEVRADAIVNAANNHLWMGGGVAGAIKRKGGKIIEEEAVRQGPIPIGEAVATSAGKLNARYVIHAAGMGTDLKTDENKIRDATLNSLRRAGELKIESIAFPSIGTGVGGFPMDRAADIMLSTTINHLKEKTSLRRVTFVLYGDEAFKTFEKVLSVIKDNETTS